MGPAATDLLKLVQGAQGTMGIVTWASVKLELEPAVRRFRFVTNEKIEPLLEMARLLTRKKLGDELLLLDPVDLSLLASCVTGETPAAAGSAGFTLFYAVAGYPGYLPGDRVAYQEKDINEIARRLDLSPAKDIAGVTGDDVGKLLDRPCPGRHWKQRLGGACQDVFFLTTMDRVPGFVEVMRGVASMNGVEQRMLGVYIQPVQQGRSCHLEFSIFYDPADKDAEARTRKAAAEAVKSMAGLGAFFSRPYEPWVNEAYARCDDTVDALRKVKAVFDPGDIMNRGKLCFKGGVTSGAR
jgi:FAD/FMN-containing dehydrogenase